LELLVRNYVTFHDVIAEAPPIAQHPQKRVIEQSRKALEADAPKADASGGGAVPGGRVRD
jgi:hypothetical protein